MKEQSAEELREVVIDVPDSDGEEIKIGLQKENTGTHSGSRKSSQLEFPEVPESGVLGGNSPFKSSTINDQHDTSPSQPPTLTIHEKEFGPGMTNGFPLQVSTTYSRGANATALISGESR